MDNQKQYNLPENDGYDNNDIKLSDFTFEDDSDFKIAKGGNDQNLKDTFVDTQSEFSENTNDESYDFGMFGSDTGKVEEDGLDDSNLTDDFVIGQDFFIDSSEADRIEAADGAVPLKRKKKKKKKSTAGRGCLISMIWMAAIFVISLTAASIILYFGMDYLGFSLDSDSAEENIEVVVTEGMSAEKVADLLEDKGVISSSVFFRFYAGRGGYAARFSDGVFYFSKQDSYEDIVEKLISKGTQAAQVKVTIPEGWTVDKIAVRLEQNGVCTAQQFKQAVNEATFEKYGFEFLKHIKTENQGVHYRLEGYLFADTYYFYQTNNKKGAEQAIKKMLDNFDKKFDQSMEMRLKEKGWELQDVITLASIIEMESSVASYNDKQKVSAVFRNRLENWDNPLLQSDPTTKYPYNSERYDTYKTPGLAPGAYCSPSIQAIKAALYPDENCEAYYFVTDKDMKFYFNETLNGHNSTIRDLKNKGLWVG